MRFIPHPCAEFPNDNPDLHDGASWVCAWTRARPRAVVAAEGVARRSVLPQPSESAPSAAVPAESVDEPAPLEADIETYFQSAADVPPVPAVVDAPAPVPEPDPPEPVVLEVEPPEPAVLEVEPPEPAVLEVEPPEQPKELVAIEQAPVEPEPSPDVAPAGLTNEDAAELTEAFDTYLGPDAHTPSEELSVIISATMPPTIKRDPVTSQAPTCRTPTHEPEQLDWLAQRVPGQLALDLRPTLPRPSDAWGNPASAQDAERAEVESALSHLDDVFDEDQTPTRVLPVAVDPPVESPVAPAPTVLEVVDAPSERLVLPRPELVVEAEQEPVGEDVIDAMAALADLFDDDQVEWQTPKTNLAVAPASGRFRVPRPAAFELDEDELDEPIAEDGASVEPLTLELTPPPPGVAGWETLTDFVSGFLLSRGATRAAALCPLLLAGRKVELARLSEPTRSALAASGIAKPSAKGLAVEAEFRRLAASFQLDFMSGRADTGALLTWLATVVGALLGHTLSQTAVRVHLEQAGIEKLLRNAA